MAEIIEVLKAVTMAGASDLHIVVGKPPMMRVNGVILPLPGAAALTADETKKMVYSILYDDQRARFEDRWELDCSISVPGFSRFRVNCFLQKNGVGAVLRTITAKIPTPAEIGLMPAIANLIELPRWLVVVTGTR